jgi:DNA-binding transcriptional ArsR family regulator
MQDRLGVEQANLSQHLAILRGKQIVVKRKEGNQVFYSLASPLLGEVLDLMRRFCRDNLNDAIQMLDEVNREGRA